MKKLLLIAILCLSAAAANAQEFFGSATNKGADGYLTGGYIKRGWGFYAGFKHSPHNLPTDFGGNLEGCDLRFYLFSTFYSLVTTNHYIKR